MTCSIIVIIASVIALKRTYSSLKAGDISIWFFLGISVMWLGAIGGSLWPQSSSFLAKILGIGRGVDFLLFVGLLLVMHISVFLYVRVKANQHDITRIVREIALRNVTKETEEHPSQILSFEEEPQPKIDLSDTVRSREV